MALLACIRLLYDVEREARQGNLRRAQRRARATHGFTGRVHLDCSSGNYCSFAEIVWDPALAQPCCLSVHRKAFTGPVVDTLVPSMVAIHRGPVVVGEGAKRHRTRAPELRLRRNRNPFFECNNDMSIRRTRHRAPEELRPFTQSA
jgi:hypothetical protein